MGIELNKKKVGSFISATLQTCFFGGLVLAALAGLRSCAHEEDRTREVTEAIDKANSAATGQRNITISDGDVVRVDHGDITTDYNFYSRQQIVSKNGGMQVFLFQQLDAGQIDTVRNSGCNKARSIKAELAKVSSEDAEADAATSLSSVQQNATDFIARHCTPPQTVNTTCCGNVTVPASDARNREPR